MSDLENRAELEAAVGKKLAPLAAAHLKEIRARFGDPPDYSKIPQSFWDKLQKDAENALAVVLIATFLTSLDNEDWDIDDDAEDEAADWASRRSREFSKLYRENTSKQVREKIKRRQDLDADDELDEDEWDDGFDSLFGDDRVERIAVTEVTTAHTGALQYLQRQTGGKLIWRCEVGACPKCDRLDGKPEHVWRRYYPDGPPAPHPNCRCYLDLVIR